MLELELKETRDEEAQQKIRKRIEKIKKEIINCDAGNKALSSCTPNKLKDEYDIF